MLVFPAIGFITICAVEAYMGVWREAKRSPKIPPTIGASSRSHHHFRATRRMDRSSLPNGDPFNLAALCRDQLPPVRSWSFTLIDSSIAHAYTVLAYRFNYFGGCRHPVAIPTIWNAFVWCPDQTVNDI